MPTKCITFDFFQCETYAGQANLPQISALEIFRRLKERFDSPEENTVKIIIGKTYEVRHLERTTYGYRGVVGKYRQTDLPHAAVPGGQERELDLQENESLLEKSFFKYFSDYSILIMQRNRLAINSEIFGNFLSMDGYSTVLNPIIEPADMQRLMRNQVSVKSLKLTVARPTNPQLFDNIEHDFSNSIIASLNSTNAANINIVVRGDGRSDDPGKRFLDPSIKRAIMEIRSRFEIKKADLLLEENGVAHPLDLVADRLMTHGEVEMLGRYPSPSGMWGAILEAREEKNAELVSYFGEINNTRLA